MAFVIFGGVVWGIRLLISPKAVKLVDPSPFTGAFELGRAAALSMQGQLAGVEKVNFAPIHSQPPSPDDAFFAKDLLRGFSEGAGVSIPLEWMPNVVVPVEKTLLILVNKIELDSMYSEPGATFLKNCNWSDPDLIHIGHCELVKVVRTYRRSKWNFSKEFPAIFFQIRQRVFEIGIANKPTL